MLDNKAGGNNKHIDTLMVLSKTLELSKKFKEALNVLNDLIAVYKDFLPALIEKAKVPNTKVNVVINSFERVGTSD